MSIFNKKENFTDGEKLAEINNILFRFSQFDGSHHKAWCLDQIARIVWGKDYDKKVAEYCVDENGEEYSWDCGIAP